MVGGQKVYVLDTNVFVEAARRYYAFDIVPGFWQMLIDQARIGNIISIDRVKSEIDRGDDDDDLKTWANSNFYPWFEGVGLALDFSPLEPNFENY